MGRIRWLVAGGGGVLVSNGFEFVDGDVMLVHKGMGDVWAEVHIFSAKCNVSVF